MRTKTGKAEIQIPAMMQAVIRREHMEKEHPAELTIPEHTNRKIFCKMMSDVIEYF